MGMRDLETRHNRYRVQCFRIVQMLMGDDSNIAVLRCCDFQFHLDCPYPTFIRFRRVERLGSRDRLDIHSPDQVQDARVVPAEFSTNSGQTPSPGMESFRHTRSCPDNMGRLVARRDFPCRTSLYSGRGSYERSHRRPWIAHLGVAPLHPIHTLAPHSGFHF